MDNFAKEKTETTKAPHKEKIEVSFLSEFAKFF